MKKHFSFLSFVCFSVYLFAQGDVKTAIINTEAGVAVTSLQIHVPDGSFSLKASETAGRNSYKACGTDMEINATSSMTGDIVNRKFTFATEAATPKRVLPVSPNSIINSSPAKENMVAYFTDPSTRTRMQIDIVKGSARVDLTKVKAEEVHIKGGSADLMVDINQPNTVAMKLLDLHTGMGKIVVRNPQFANAEVVNINNEMGDIRLVVAGNASNCHSKFVLKSTVGSTFIVIDQAQPVKIIIRKSALTTLTLPPSYTSEGNNVYVNAAYRKSHTEFITITCDKDAGSIEIQEN